MMSMITKSLRVVGYIVSTPVEALLWMGHAFSYAHSQTLAREVPLPFANVDE